MKRRPYAYLAIGAAAAACLAAAYLASAAASTRAPEPPKPCCFVNESFAGVCRVVPAEGETCEAIEAYLNNPSSSGRTYCDSTTLRGGWTRVDCRTGKPSREPQPTPSEGRRSASDRHGATNRR